MPSPPEETPDETRRLLTDPDPVAVDRLRQARTRFLTRNPFLGVVLLDLPPEERVTVRSLTSDGRRIYYNPEFVRRAPLGQLEGHLLHVVLHWALGHAWRGQGRDLRRWRSASDLALVPLFLRSAYDYSSILPLKASAELGRGRSVEEVYAILPESEGEPTEMESSVADVEECWQEPAGETAAQVDLARRWRERLVRAAQAAESSGRDIEVAEEVLTALGRPTVDWRDRLRRFVQRTYAADYSWIPPNRRYLYRGIYLPGTRSRQVGDLVVAVDTSGSIDPAVAARFLGEVSAMREMVGGSGRLFLMLADDEIRYAEELRPGVDLPRALKGRGNTDFRPVFERVEAAQLRPTGVVYLTDGDGEFPERRPNVPVLWVLPANVHVPWGEKVILPNS